MPRTARAIEAGMIYHVLNRGNSRRRIFRNAGDYEAFERVLAEGVERYPVDLLTYSLMPSHWHLVARPRTDEALGRWMGWAGVTYARRCHERCRSRGGGRLYQGRFKSFPVAEDDSFLALCRYVEASARRADLVERAEQWRWCGLWRRAHARRHAPAAGDLILAPWPLERPRNWLARVNRPLNDEQLQRIRTCVQRGRPLGPEAWVRQTAARLGLEFTLRNPGRPRKTAEESE